MFPDKLVALGVICLGAVFFYIGFGVKKIDNSYLNFENKNNITLMIAGSMIIVVGLLALFGIIEVRDYSNVLLKK
jgi:hypothetical protein